MSPQGRRDAARTLLAAGLGLAAQLARAQSEAQRPASASPMAAPAAGQPSPRLGLALGGGSSRGFAHVGVLKSLEQAGIKPEVIVGTSAGALIGAFRAAGVGAFQIEEIALRTREIDLTDLSAGNRRGLMAGEALNRFVAQQLRNVRIEDMPTRYAAVTTDLRSGEQVLLRNGAVADAVRASCSIPGVFVPRELGGRELVDGGLVSPLPVRAARQLGCDVVLAIDVAARPNRESVSGLYEIVMQSFEIMGRALADQEAETANLVVRPTTQSVSSTDFSQRKELIQAGYEAMQRSLPELRRILQRPNRPRRS